MSSCEGWMYRLANSWRTGPDAQANWASVMANVDTTEPLYALAGPTGPIGGHYNDADLLEVRGWPGVRVVRAAAGSGWTSG